MQDCFVHTVLVEAKIVHIYASIENCSFQDSNHETDLLSTLLALYVKAKIDLEVLFSYV